MAETAVVYDAGEQRTHAEHAAEAYDHAARADALIAMRDTAVESGTRERLEMAAAVSDARAQWHATMAVYEALIVQRPSARP